MINNRQNGRRRGRGGGQRPPNNMQGSSGGGGGNRQDNRQRGNAAQLLEKYKAMARDAQLAGDRVQTEYYLQFADHYHRVLSETRSRFENDNRRPQNDFSDEEEYQEEGAEADQGERREYQQREQRESRNQRDYEPREQTPETYANDSEEQPRNTGELRPRRQRNPRRERPEFNGEAGGEERIALEVLPPAIGIEPAAEEEAPRRRTRRPRATEGGEDIAPAA